MPTLDFEAAIDDFLALGRKLQAAQPLTGQKVLDELTDWYRKSRVDGAAVDEDKDMLLLQWGKTTPMIVPEPTDTRNCDDDDIEFAEEDVQYLDFTRQVVPTGESEDEDEEEEFDDVAVQMSITLGFEPAKGDEKSSNVWIHTPNDIDTGKKGFVGEPFVKSLLNVPAQSVAITVNQCG